MNDRGLPVMLVDVGEKKPWRFRCPVRSERLLVGDYTLDNLLGIAAVERKGFTDLIRCCARGERLRLAGQFAKLATVPHRWLIVDGEWSQIYTKQYWGPLRATEIVQLLAALEVDHQVPVLFAGNWGAQRALSLLEHVQQLRMTHE